jgi:20S proteasome subunit beta 7
MQGATEHTTQPIVTGTSVLAVKYAGGVLMMTDTLGSYGSMARFKELERMHVVNNQTIIGCGGEYSDFQELKRYLTDLMVEDFEQDDGVQYTPKEIFSYLSRVYYNRRSEFNPLWNQIITIGYDNKQPFLGYVDMQGTNFVEDFAATGYGAYLAIPILREGWRADLNFEEAKTLLENAMRVLVYRDCRTINKFCLARVDGTDARISPPYSLNTKWNFERFVNPRMA